MPRYAAFLRAINVGNRRLKMDRLQSIFTEAGYTKVTTLIASGNVWFHTPLRSVAKLRTQIEQTLLESLGFDVDTFLRTDSQLRFIDAANPFETDQAKDDLVHVHVLFFHEPIPIEASEALRRNQTATDRVEIIGTEVYWRCKGRMSESNYWTQPEIKKIKLPNNTARNIQTIKRMIAVKTGS